MNELKQQIRFCTSADGTHIGDAVSGESLPPQLRAWPHTIAD